MAGELTAKEKDILILAALETIKTYQVQMFRWKLTKSSGSDTTAQLLEYEIREQDRIYVVTAMSAVDKTTASKIIRLGLYDGTKYNYYTAKSTGTSKESVDFSGQILARQGDKLAARFEAIGASDEIEFTMNGYWLKD